MILMMKNRHQRASSRSSAASPRSSITSTGAKDVYGHVMLPSKHRFWNRMRASRTSSSPSRTPCIMLDSISLHLCPWRTITCFSEHASSWASGKAPVNQDGARYRGHIDHAKYILKSMEASTRDHPCVPGHQDDITGHQAMEIEEEDQTIEHEDGTITVPIEYLTVTHPSEPGN